MIKHSKFDGAPPSSDPSKIDSTAWNDGHIITDPAAVSASLGFPVVSGDPNGTVSATRGSIARDTALGQLWLNISGSTTGDTGSVWTTLLRADGGSATPTTFVAEIGDSNEFGLGSDGSKAAGEFQMLVPDPNTIYNSYFALNDNDPPTFTEQTTGALRSVNQGGVDKCGPEITMGPVLERAFAPAAPWIAKMCVVGSTIAQWTPSSTFYLASTGKNLYATWRDRMRPLLAAAGRRLGACSVNLGSADAINSTDANNVTANMIEFMDQVRADFGNQVVFAWGKVHVALAEPNVTTVRAQQVAVVGYPNFRLIDCDDLNENSDLIHFPVNDEFLYGQRKGFAILDMMGYPRQAMTTTPQMLGYGVPTVGSGSLVCRAWPGSADGHTMFGFVASVWTSGSPIDCPTPSGWTLVTNGTCTVSGETARYSLFSRSVLQADIDANGGRLPTVTFSPGGNENVAQLFTVGAKRRFVTAAHAAAFTTVASGTGPFSAGGVTTVTGEDNALVMVFVAAQAGSLGAGNVVTATNSTLTGFARIKDAPYGMPDSNFVNLAAFGGMLPAHGSSGTSQVSATVNSFVFGITAAVSA